MLEKSVAAMLSAIEIYNKPDFKYREETFSVLCINSWELLLKAKVLNLAGNKPAALYVLEHKTLKNGERSRIKRPKRNRSGNPMSVGLFDCCRIITEEYGTKIDRAALDNLIALTEIRDNAIHFVNDDLTLSLKVQELGTASLQNYLHLVHSWFGDVLAGYNFYLMPISFFRDFDTAKGTALNSAEKKLLSYIKSVESRYDEEDEPSNYNLTLRIDVKFQKGNSAGGLPVQVTNDPSAPEVRLAEEDIIDKYPWDYLVLTTRLSKRYVDFKANKKYHDTRKALEENPKFAHQRFLNPNNPKGGKKTLYNPNIIKEFDAHYQRAT
ncbi:MAG: DUF3644 domain-containing protein [Pseudomonadota bacterium]